MSNCPFCKDNWNQLNIVKRAPFSTMAIVVPLNPVTEGHVLVIPGDHWQPTEFDTGAFGKLAEYATRYIKSNEIDANLIWNCGPAATQTIEHTHLHIVPRHKGDGLLLPWSNQAKPTPAHNVTHAGAVISIRDRAKAYGLRLTDEQVAKLEAYVGPRAAAP